jgi:hypothetical protein
MATVAANFAVWPVWKRLLAASVFCAILVVDDKQLVSKYITRLGGRRILGEPFAWFLRRITLWLKNNSREMGG